MVDDKVRTVVLASERGVKKGGRERGVGIRGLGDEEGKCQVVGGVFLPVGWFHV
jgi:hypothetical protein